MVVGDKIKESMAENRIGPVEGAGLAESAAVHGTAT
jgi:hypothetical protein